MRGRNVQLRTQDVRANVARPFSMTTHVSRLDCPAVWGFDPFPGPGSTQFEFAYRRRNPGSSGTVRVRVLLLTIQKLAPRLRQSAVVCVCSHWATKGCADSP